MYTVRVWVQDPCVITLPPHCWLIIIFNSHARNHNAKPHPYHSHISTMKPTAKMPFITMNSLWSFLVDTSRKRSFASDLNLRSSTQTDFTEVNSFDSISPCPNKLHSCTLLRRCRQATASIESCSRQCNNFFPEEDQRTYSLSNIRNWIKRKQCQHSTALSPRGEQANYQGPICEAIESRRCFTCHHITHDRERDIQSLYASIHRRLHRWVHGRYGILWWSRLSLQWSWWSWGGETLHRLCLSLVYPFLFR